MSDSYLDLAERVLLELGCPLTPKEILRQAHLRMWVPQHLHGRTQHKTLQARLSEEIARYPGTSRFYRTGPGRFFVRQPSAEQHEIWRASPRWKELRREFVLVVQATALGVFLTQDGLLPGDRVEQLVHAAEYRPQSEYRESNRFIPIHTFMVVHKKSRALMYRRGRHTDPLAGDKSVGVETEVYDRDSDLLYRSFLGIVGAGIRELVQSVGLNVRASEELRYNDILRPRFGLIAPSGRLERSLQIIIDFKCPDTFDPLASANLRSAQWIASHDFGNRLEDFDVTSQFLFQTGELKRILHN